MKLKSIADKAIALAIADGWELDNSPATELSDKNWYRFDACTPAILEETLVDRYYDKAFDDEVEAQRAAEEAFDNFESGKTEYYTATNDTERA